MTRVEYVVNQAEYVNTLPGAPDLFAPPEPVADYAAWLSQRAAARTVESLEEQFCGVAQRIQQLRFIVSQHPFIRIFAVGPYAETAADFIEQATDGFLRIERV